MKKKKRYLIIRYTIKYIKVIFMILGCFYITESVAERNIPEMQQYTLNYNPEIISHSKLAASKSDKERWEALEIPLKILEDVNPTAHKWILDLYKKKKIQFTSREAEYNPKEHIHSYLCKYDWINGKLMISNTVWAENDGTIAVLLCHEYRHSIQSYFKRFRYVISFVFFKEGNDAVIENDAYLYEREAYMNIFKIEYPFY